MDKEVLKQQLARRFQASLDEALAAVDRAPDGQWIAASEWQVREVFQKLTTDCYQSLIQQRAKESASGSQAAFSPSAGKKQGKPKRSHSDGLR